MCETPLWERFLISNGHLFLTVTCPPFFSSFVCGNFQLPVPNQDSGSFEEASHGVCEQCYDLRGQLAVRLLFFVSILFLFIF